MTQVETNAAMDDVTLDAWAAHARFKWQTSNSGPLAGLPFAVKDCIDIAGYPTGQGHPGWLAASEPASETAPPVSRLLDAGAVYVGKTQMDELGWSLNGVNHHYGIPLNPRAPDRIPGGSSSGSATLVAAGIVPFSLGADGGGSVRVPSSYCGLIGIRPTVGRVPWHGGDESSSLATVGWLAQDLDVFMRVSSVLLDGPVPPRPPSRLFRADDLFAEVDPGVEAALSEVTDRITNLCGGATGVDVAEGQLSEWRETYRVLQARNFWKNYGTWVSETHPVLGPDIAARFEMAAAVDDDRVAEAAATRKRICRRVWDLLDGDAVLVAPTTPGAALPRTSSISELEARRAQALKLTCTAGLATVPQLSLPLAELDGCPLGISLIAARGNEEILLQLARELKERPNEHR